MSTIVFEGNTYTFGATVSANPGTGTTSYVFGGLNSGQTYGFIIWAFNGFGSSSIVGPATQITLSQIPEEQRPAVNLFSWQFPYTPLSGINSYYSGNDTNLMLATDDLSNTTFWSYGLPGAGASMIGGQTDPFGGTSAFLWTSFTTGGGTIVSTSGGGNPTVGLPGNTYILSFWIDGSRGVTNIPAYGAGSPAVYMPSLARFATLYQIMPYTGTAGQPMQFAPGSCGWVRYAWEFAPSDGWLEIRLINASAGGGSQRRVYIYGPQLELA
jgi:hypothetical protein